MCVDACLRNVFARFRFLRSSFSLVAADALSTAVHALRKVLPIDLAGLCPLHAAFVSPAAHRQPRPSKPFRPSQPVLLPPPGSVVVVTGTGGERT